ncbi:response regulator [Thalassotalea euphylliae]|uniref:Response regulator n=1 Tax=Thalassotalea euphylliae TaxID=1655234 RepID=A0A3E0TIP9_9GAMM|nr:response regulator [Thalassotalea euphylliae]REL24399.1 response regulator [Thalassotalea euphylliae]REL35937.1 response regulator [Thalassotalea euphylliae]
MRILVVDDMDSMRHVMIRMLKSIGYEQVEEAVNGIQALDLLKARQYDVIITDYHMPKLDGFGLLQRIRGNESLAHIPVLLVTCEDKRSEVELFIKAGVNGVMFKPFTANTLIKQLNWIKESLVTKQTASAG